ncbi:hypothetical protein [Kribbella sp. DT2]|uniref:hypothetical protein n=1 Tax=Kribbella sp. DT2 TaxID=3393427 RepID=UPI003CEDDCD7
MSALPHEGLWAAARTDAQGRPLVWTSWFRPDPAHLPVTAAAALLPRDVKMTSDVVAVRQNLDLVVTGGRLVDGLTLNAQGRWGSVRSQFQ